jgi:hypothetical protein
VTYEKWLESKKYVEELKASPFAIETDAANEQHYEIPAEFIRLCLGRGGKTGLISTASCGRGSVALLITGSLDPEA